MGEIEALRQALNYDAASGALTWAISPGARAKLGDEVGCIDGEGYRTFIYRGKQYLAHRVIWAIVYGEWPQEIDHADRNRANNRLTNLTDGDHFENCQNRDLGPLGPSGVRGVTYHKKSGRWMAQFRHRGRNYYVGLFGTPEAAGYARQQAKEGLA